MGSVNGIALLTKNYEMIKDKELYLFTVGSSDVTVPEVTKTIRSGLEQKLPPALWAKLHVYHLRGGMQFSKLSLLHRMMIGMMIKMLRKKPENQRTGDEQGMLETISQDTDFTDRISIAPLIADIKSSTVPQ